VAICANRIPFLRLNGRGAGDGKDSSFSRGGPRKHPEASCQHLQGQAAPSSRRARHHLRNATPTPIVLRKRLEERAHCAVMLCVCVCVCVCSQPCVLYIFVLPPPCQAAVTNSRVHFNQFPPTDMRVLMRVL
uniref:Uncharacterized protein n=1 Tax=Gasterosteus aculeatus TaxID=69293 RepID=G3NQY8_GASAC